MLKTLRLCAPNRKPLLFLLSLIVVVGCGKGSKGGSKQTPIYQRSNLVSDISNYIDGAGTTLYTDPRLINPQGLSDSPTGPFWIALNGYGLVGAYDKTGFPISTPVNIPAPSSDTNIALVTDVAYNGTTGFVITAGGPSAPAQFLYTTQDGLIAGWNPAVLPTSAIPVVDQSANSQSNFTGIALGTNAGANYLYAADFRQGVVQMFDTTFKSVGTFTDPTNEAGYAPYGIRNIKGKLYVTFAKQDANKLNALPGAGFGFIDVFSTAGVYQQRLVSHAQLNVPWGITLSPSTFGKYPNKLLVANNADGVINVFDPSSGSYSGQLDDGASSNPIMVPGLWGLQFGNGGQAGNLADLYFTAGLNGGKDGLVGKIKVVMQSQ